MEVFLIIKEATRQDTEEVAKLALLLWPRHSLEELRQEMHLYLANTSAAIFLTYHDKEAVGFAQCQLRHDYVEGTSSSPVGYLEGLFVEKNFRKQGFAKQMVDACEKWSKSKGASEFASDCELTNEDSLAMHVKLGFSEANRLICFTKRL